MTEQARTSIRLVLPESAQDWGALPVRVLRTNGLLVAQGRSGEEIAVDPGQYLVSIRLPNGDEEFAEDVVDLEAGENEEVRIDCVSPAMVEQLETRSNMRAPGRPAKTAGIASFFWTGHLFSTDLLEIGGTGERPGPQLSASEQADVVPPDGSGDAALVCRYHSAEYGPRARISLVPGDAQVGIETLTPGRATMAAVLVRNSAVPMVQFASKISVKANMLLNYIEHSGLGEMEQVADSFVRRGAEAMQDTDMSLMLATAAAYVKLRVDSLDGLEQWLQGIGQFARPLPDIHILTAELLARRGRHDEAIEAIHAALVGDCPWFRSGVAYLADRVRQYIAIDESRADAFKLQDKEAFVGARARFEHLLDWMDPKALLTTFDVPLQGNFAASS